MHPGKCIGASVLAALLAVSQAAAIEVDPVYKDLTNPNINLFSDTTGPISIIRTGFNGNTVHRFRIDEGTTNGGGGFVIPLSNGENGTNVGPGDGNNDVPNPTPVGAAIDIVNGGDGTQGNRLSNGNVFRFSVWMQQDPAEPVVVEPSVEPVLKFELWSEAQSTFGDFTAGRAPSAAFGDRLWDTDINARDSFYDGHNQSLSSPVDISGNNAVVSGDVPVVSIPPATGEQWVLVETTLVIDDDPDDSGFGWDVAGTGYQVGMVEEVRATFFMGDFQGILPSTQLNDGGSIFVDNALLEIFPDVAAMQATPNPNPLPVPAITGDYNDNGAVDAADYVVWRNFLNQSGANLKNRDPAVTGLVKQADYDVWRKQFGQGSPGSGAGVNAMILAYAPSQSIPEPSSCVLVALASIAALGLGRIRR
jgi:hypothetical protein